MTQEEKELLIRDLCSRLPYSVKMRTNYGTDDIIVELCGLDTDENTVNICRFRCENGKLCDNNNPLFTRMGESRYLSYLFPLSSMTEEQALELEKIDPEFYSLICENGNIHISMDIRGYDWLLKNNFDFRGLIPIGLALDATGLNIY